MEYRCRLGTPGGDIIEGVYAADSEARLRREFEEKGLYVLAMHQAGRRALAGVRLPQVARRRAFQALHRWYAADASEARGRSARTARR